jgi:hypothetical protein
MPNLSKLQWAVIWIGFVFAFCVDTRGIGPVSDSGLGVTFYGVFHFFSALNVTIITAIAVLILVWMLEGARRK